MKHDDGERGPRRLPARLSALLAALAGLAYVLWKRLRKQKTSPSEQAELGSSAPRAAGKELSRGWLKGALLVGALLTGGVVALLIFGGVPPALARILPGFDFFDGREPAAFDGQQAWTIVLEDAQSDAQNARAAVEHERLESYGWVNEEEGIAHIPLQRAMDLIVATGLPAAALAPTSTATVASATPSAQMTATPTSPSGDGSPQHAPDPTGAVQGEQLFSSLGCQSCHPGGRAGTGPALISLMGREVELQSGETVVAGEEYIRRSILHPGEQVVAGYPDVMPGFDGQLSEQVLDQLIAYIQALGGENATPAP